MAQAPVLFRFMFVVCLVSEQVDGRQCTLHRQRIKARGACKRREALREKICIGVVGGSDLAKQKEQLGDSRDPRRGPDQVLSTLVPGMYSAS